MDEEASGGKDTQVLQPPQSESCLRPSAQTQTRTFIEKYHTKHNASKNTVFYTCVVLLYWSCFPFIAAVARFKLT